MTIAVYESLVNIKHSIEKYLYDSFEAPTGITVVTSPMYERTQNQSQFVVLLWQDRNMKEHGRQSLRIFLNQRLDIGSFKLFKMRDDLMNVLWDVNPNTGFTDRSGVRQIPFYDCADTANPVEVGKLGLRVTAESQTYSSEDGSGFLHIDVDILYPA